jgi:hypothetical protein
MRLLSTAPALTVFLALGACSSTGVVQTDKDTYMVAKRSAQMGFGPADGVKAEVYQDANAHCSQQGKKVETVSIETTPSGFARPAAASLQFRCVN